MGVEKFLLLSRPRECGLFSYKAGRPTSDQAGECNWMLKQLEQYAWPHDYLVQSRKCLNNTRIRTDHSQVNHTNVSQSGFLTDNVIEEAQGLSCDRCVGTPLHQVLPSGPSLDEVAHPLGHTGSLPRRYARLLASAQQNIADRPQRVMDEMVEQNCRNECICSRQLYCIV